MSSYAHERTRTGSPTRELAKVFETGDPTLIPVIESLLNSAEIEFLVKNEALQTAMPGASYAVGAVQYWVHREQEQDVCELLRQLADPSSEATDSE